MSRVPGAECWGCVYSDCIPGLPCRSFHTGFRVFSVTAVVQAGQR